MAVPPLAAHGRTASLSFWVDLFSLFAFWGLGEHGRWSLLLGGETHVKKSRDLFWVCGVFLTKTRSRLRHVGIIFNPHWRWSSHRSAMSSVILPVSLVICIINRRSPPQSEHSSELRPAACASFIRQQTFGSSRRPGPARSTGASATASFGTCTWTIVPSTSFCSALQQRP